MSKPIMTTLIFGLLSGFGIIVVGTFTMHLWAWSVVMKGFVLLNKYGSRWRRGTPVSPDS